MLYKDYLNHRKQYQEAGRDLLLTKKHACLFFEPGKGKTYPAIEAMQEVNRQKNGKAKVLIISTCDAIRKMWQVDIVPQNILPKDTFLVTDRTAIGNIAPALLETKWDIVLIDECHIVKSHRSKIHKLVFKLCRRAEYAWGLTGTPRGNRDVDIWCQLHALHVGGQGKMSFTAWTRNYCTFDIGYGPYGRYETPMDIREKWLPWWNDLLDEYALFVTYDEDDNMPQLDTTVIKIPYKKTELYEQAYKGIIEVGEFATTTTKMVAISKAHQACNGYIYLPDKVVHREHENGKLKYLREYVSGKCVIVYKHIADHDDLKKYFGNKATDDVNAFKSNKYDVLLLQCGMCQSFNLQDICNTIIFYTMDYSFIKYKQMIHRCWRIGQKKNVQIIILEHEGTVEKQIWSAVSNKQKIHDLYMSIKNQ